MAENLLVLGAPHNRQTRPYLYAITPTSHHAEPIGPDLREAYLASILSHHTQDEDLVVVSPLNGADWFRDTVEGMEGIHLHKPPQGIPTHIFQGALEPGIAIRRPNKHTLYIATDGSRDHLGKRTSFAWCSSAGDYRTVIRGERNINELETEAIFTAVLDNADTTHGRVHIYTDSMVAKDMWEGAVVGGRKIAFVQSRPDLALKVEAVREVAANLNIKVQWVRSHKKHRLNIVADGIAFFARVAAKEGRDADEVQRELRVAHLLLSRSLGLPVSGWEN